MKHAKANTGDLDWPMAAGVTSDVVARIREKAPLYDTRRARRARRARSAIAALALVVVGGAWGVSFVRYTARIETVGAGRETVTLRDGSSAELNARTQVRTDFRWGRRKVRMECGEAFFSVAKDAEHPFLVETPRGTIRVTGTQFNVRLAADGTAEVTLLEGGITFEEQRRAPIEVTPGQQLRATSADVGVETLPAAKRDSILAWREGRLVFDGLTLGEAAERLASFHGREIAVARDIADLRADGSVGIENFAGALDALQVVLPIQVFGTAESGYRIVAR